MYFAKSRVEELKGEVAQFRKGPVNYLLDKQIIRKYILLEYFDWIRPVRGTEWEHAVEQWRRSSTGKIMEKKGKVRVKM
jgi:hypothetical protein